MDVDAYLNLNPDIQIINQSSSSMLEHEKSIEDIEEIKKRGNFLLRQELEDKTPINTPKCIIIYHTIFIIIFSSISFIILFTNQSKNFIEEKYNNSCTPKSICEFNFSIPINLKSPIYFYYKLNNFYSNHIDYVKSKNYAQLRGEIVDDKTIDLSCKYMSRNKDHFKNTNESLILSYENITMDSDSIMNPCGLIADSLFNDKFKLYDINGNNINIIEQNITSEIDKEKIYKNNINSENIQWLNKEDEHFIVWMNMELFPDFIKKWGYIDQDLPKGDYKISIENNWGKPQWEVSKYFVFAKGNCFGTSKFFGYVLIACTGLQILFILIIYLSKYRKKKFNPEEMKWD